MFEKCFRKRSNSFEHMLALPIIEKMLNMLQQFLKRAKTVNITHKKRQFLWSVRIADLLLLMVEIRKSDLRSPCVNWSVSLLVSKVKSSTEASFTIVSAILCEYSFVELYWACIAILLNFNISESVITRKKNVCMNSSHRWVVTQRLYSCTKVDLLN